MSLKSKFNRLAVYSALIVSVALVGCGNRMPANLPDPEEPALPPAPPVEPALPVEPVQPVVPPTLPTLPGMPGNPGYQGPTLGSLVVSGVEKSKTGLILKKLVVKGSVVNVSSTPLSGTLKIDFKDKKGLFTKTFVTEETKTQVISQLAPGQSFPFEVTSTKNGMDDAEVTVETMQTAPAASVYSSGSPYGAPAMGGYGAYGAGPAGMPGYPTY
ncbi:MAG: hypothetical protein VKN33_05480 [Candidatus Sericytochromatia bacterium]|nr:hypothetical protein [Candidatus Sericytochromatia bacterium]